MEVRPSKNEMKEVINQYTRQELIDKLFLSFDRDGSQTISKFEFPNFFRGLFQILGNEYPTNEDVQDIFHQLDINGDQNISKNQMMALIDKLFTILNEADFVQAKLDTDDY